MLFKLRRAEERGDNLVRMIKRWLTPNLCFITILEDEYMSENR
jgi:hypothetical protein